MPLESLLEQTVPFSTYMHECLFGEDGYYTSGKVDFKEHFVTYPAKSPVFGWTLARYAIQLYKSMGRPSGFTILEQGAGNGDLAKTLLDYISLKDPGMYESIDYQIEEISPALIERQKEKTISHNNISWKNKSAIELGEDLEGLIITNELPDAFPVEVIKNINGEIKQRYVKINDNGNCEPVYLDLSVEVKEYFEKYQINVKSGVSIPININAQEWMKNLSSRLKKGSIITIDYTQDFSNLDPENEPIRCYGRINGEKVLRDKEIQKETIYLHPSNLDLTSDVDFSVLEKICNQFGFKTTFSSEQMNLLISLGIKEVVEESVDLFEKFDPDNYRGFINGINLAYQNSFYIQISSKNVDIKLDQEEFEYYGCWIVGPRECVVVEYDENNVATQIYSKYLLLINENNPPAKIKKGRCDFFKSDLKIDSRLKNEDDNFDEVLSLLRNEQLLLSYDPNNVVPRDFKNLKPEFSAQRPGEDFPKEI